MASELWEFEALGHMTSQPSKTAKVRSHKLMRVVDLGTHWGSLSQPLYQA
jgi:hypothetical protein